MIYIYDLLLNYQDNGRLVEFFEWSEDDILEHIKRIPLFVVPSIDIDHFCFSNIKVDSKFLESIKGKTLFYKKKKSIFYSALFCDLNRVIAVEFSRSGEVLAKSCLLLDEEEEVIESSKGIDEVHIPYKVIDDRYPLSFLTRTEEFQKHYLLSEISSFTEEKDIDLFNYLYEEVFGYDNLSFDLKLKKLMDDISNNFDIRYRNVYNIIRLSYSKK
ncbi:MAG: hypothetical protein SOU84_03985 [Candidatus Faecimonas sp.]|nr:hypothetical protein [Mycoplasmatota bacterium]MDY2908300.1 hypothetical protein [Candidatus Faecimonas sp.]